MKKLQNKKGFTMAELLIVVAIIAVLVAISIPIFTSRLESAREATDLANLRNAYAEVSTAYLTDNSTQHKVTVPLKQTKDGWASASPMRITLRRTGVTVPFGAALRNFTSKRRRSLRTPRRTASGAAPSTWSWARRTAAPTTWAGRPTAARPAGRTRRS